MFWSKKAKLDLIDLDKYEKECLRQRNSGIDVRPPPIAFAGTTAGVSDLTEKELQAVRENQATAMSIYRRYSQKG